MPPSRSGWVSPGSRTLNLARPRSSTTPDSGALLVELSEPDGFYADNNYVSNELGLQRVLPNLEQRFEPGGVYLGVGPEQNFSYVAALRPRIAFIVDIRRQNAMEHLMYKALFELSENRADFVSLLFSRPSPPGLDSESTVDALFTAYRAAAADRALFETSLASILRVLVERHGFALDDADRASVAKVFSAFYEEGPEIHYVFRERDQNHPRYFEVMEMTDDSGTNWSYLGSEERFQRVKRMQRANVIVPVVGDVGGTKTMRAIGDYVRGLRDTIDVFYVSNVERYLFLDGPWRSFYENVSTFHFQRERDFHPHVLRCGPAVQQPEHTEQNACDGLDRRAPRGLSERGDRDGMRAGGAEPRVARLCKLNRAWRARRDSNPRPLPPEGSALSTELRARARQYIAAGAGATRGDPGPPWAAEADAISVAAGRTRIARCPSRDGGSPARSGTARRAGCRRPRRSSPRRTGARRRRT